MNINCKLILSSRFLCPSLIHSFLFSFFFVKFQIQEKKTSETIEKGPNYNADPTGQRTGNPPDGSLSETLERVAQDLEEYVDKVRLIRSQKLIISLLRRIE